MTEIEKKAEEYAKECFPKDEFKQAMVEDGCLKFYEQGQKDTIRGDCTPIRYVLVDLIDSNNPIALLRKENAELKAQIEKMKELVKEKKCKNCKGRGLVQIAKDVRGLTECPVCKGTGKILQGIK